MSDVASETREVAVTAARRRGPPLPRRHHRRRHRRRHLEVARQGGARRTIDGRLWDLSQPIEADARVAILTAKDEARRSS